VCDLQAVFDCISNIYALAVSFIPGTFFVIVLPFILFVALVKFIRNM